MIAAIWIAYAVFLTALWALPTAPTDTARRDALDAWCEIERCDRQEYAAMAVRLDVGPK